MTLKLAHIAAAVAEAWSIAPRDLRRETRTPVTVEARWAFARLAREMTDASYPAIGRALGQHHTSAMNGAASMEARLVESDTARLRFEGARGALLILERAGLAHLLGSLDAVAIARRIEAQPERHAAMATVHEITAMAQHIVEWAGPADAPVPEFPKATTQQETDHAA